MLSRRRAMVLTATFFSTPAWALSFSLDFQRLIDDSTVVALVNIESGGLSRPNGRLCGAVYEARVLQPIKGAAAGESLTFGYFLSHRIGSDYFVFLDSRDKLLAATQGRIAPPMHSDVPYVSECRARMPPLIEVAEGLGTIEVVAGETVELLRSVVLSSPLYQVPETWLKGQSYRGDIFDGMLYGSAQISVQRFLSSLRALYKEER